MLTAMVEHHVWLTGEMVRVAGQLTTISSTSRSSSTSTRTGRRSAACCHGWSGRWDVERRDGKPRVRLVGREHESLASLRARRRSKDLVPRRTCASWSRPVGSTRRSSTRCACRPYVFTYGGNVAHVMTFAAHRPDPGRPRLRPPRARRARLGQSMTWCSRARLSDSGARDTPEGARPRCRHCALSLGVGGQDLRRELFLALAIQTSAAVWLAVNNPEIHGADNALYTCAAAWDTAVDDADNVAGGQPVRGWRRPRGPLRRGQRAAASTWRWSPARAPRWWAP